MAQDVSIDLVFQAIDNVTKTVNQVNSSVQSINNNKFDKITSGVTALSVGFLAVEKAVSLAYTGFNKLVDIIQEGIKESSDFQKSQILLANALGQTANGSQEAYDSLTAYADQLERATGIEDTAIINAQRLLVQYGVQTESINSLVGGIADYSAALGIDLSSAAQQVARVIEGGTNSLGRFKLGLTETSSEAERTAKVMEFFGRFSGTAAASAETFSGRLTIFNNSVNEVKKSLGSLVTENTFVIEALRIASDAFYKLQGFIEKNKEALMEFVKNGIIIVLKALSSFIGGLETTIDLYKGFTGETDEATKAVNALSLELKGLEKAKIFSEKGGFFGVGKDLEQAKKLQEEIDKVKIKLEEANKGKEKTNIFTNAQTSLNEIIKNLDSLSAKKEIKVNLKLPTQDEIQNTIGQDFKLAMKSLFTGDFADFSLKAKDAFSKMGKNLEQELPKIIRTITDSFKNIQFSGAGAQKLIQDLLKTSGSAIGAMFGSPQAGEAIANVLAQFAQPAEQFKKNVQEFFSQLKVIIESLPQNVRVFIEELVKAIPEIMQAIKDFLPALIDELTILFSDPAFWESVAKASATSMALTFGDPTFVYRLQIAFTTGFMQAIPAIVQGYINEVKIQINDLFGNVGKIFTDAVSSFNSAVAFFNEAISKIKDVGGGIGGAVGGIGGFVGGITKKLGFADGGEVPIIAHSGETVIDRSTTEQLKQFLSIQQRGQNVTVVVKVSEKQLAETLVNLNYAGFRTA